VAAAVGVLAPVHTGGKVTRKNDVCVPLCTCVCMCVCVCVMLPLYIWGGVWGGRVNGGGSGGSAGTCAHRGKIAGITLNHLLPMP